MVPLKIHRVLAGGDTVGDASNRGCRLDSSDISTIVGDLRNNAAIFGTNVEFSWDGSIDDLIDSDISIDPAMRTVAVSDWMDPTRMIWGSSPWDTGSINIYFVGNVQPEAFGNPPYNYVLTAATFWPGPFTINSTDFSDGVPQQIFVNDGGGDLLSGTVPDATAANLASFHMLCHEMDHYLGRFYDETIPYTGSIYDGSVAGSDDKVHDYSMYPLRPNNLLRWGGLGPGNPYPLVVPGDVNVSNDSEIKRTLNRVTTATWNVP